MTDTILAELIQLSHRLGAPDMDCAILGEGNTSARADAASFWVKASGASLSTLDESGLVHVAFDGVLDLLTQESLSDVDIRKALEAARIDPQARALPSVETVLHALALQLEGVNFVGHTHPTAVNSILCSRMANEAFAGRLFPDEIVYCGPAPVFVPWTDPGLPLARAVQRKISEFGEKWGQPPKVILMQNHGFIALGKTAADVINITAMGVKAARVLIGTYALGGPHFLSAEAAERIHTRPDEHYRKSIWGTR